MTKNARQNPAESLTEKHIDLLWQVMTRTFGNTWTSSFGAVDDGTWLKILDGVTPRQVAHGLDEMRKTWAGAFPPNALQFRELCVDAPALVESRAMYKPYKRLPSPNADKETAKKALGEAREKLRSAKTRDSERKGIAVCFNDDEYEYFTKHGKFPEDEERLAIQEAS